jgi:hypothetical protein
MARIELLLLSEVEVLLGKGPCPGRLRYSTVQYAYRAPKLEIWKDCLNVYHGRSAMECGSQPRLDVRYCALFAARTASIAFSDHNRAQHHSLVLQKVSAYEVLGTDLGVQFVQDSPFIVHDTHPHLGRTSVPRRDGASSRGCQNQIAYLISADDDPFAFMR